MRCRAWNLVSTDLRRVVHQWTPRRPRLARLLFTKCCTDPTHFCEHDAHMAQIGDLIFVGIENHWVIHVYSEDAQYVRSWQPDQYTPEWVNPYGLAASPTGELVVLDAHERCVKVFRTDGTLVRTMGRQCFEPYPVSLAVTADGRVLISDEQRVHVFSLSDGVCVARWPPRRYNDESNSCLCIVASGTEVMIPNWQFHHIDVIRMSDGQVARRWGKFRIPRNVMLWQDYLFVTDLDQLHVFRKQDETCLYQLSTKLLGLARADHLLVTHKGQLWISDMNRHCIGVFDWRPRVQARD